MSPWSPFRFIPVTLGALLTLSGLVLGCGSLLIGDNSPLQASDPDLRSESPSPDLAGTDLPSLPPDMAGTAGSPRCTPGVSAVNLALPGVGPSAIALDADHVYWLQTGGTPLIGRVSKAGGGWTTVTSIGKFAGSLVVDDTSVYWSSGSPPRLFRAAKTGGAPALLAETKGDLALSRLFVDAAHLYWVDTGGPMRVAKTGGVPVALDQRLTSMSYRLAATADGLYVLVRDSLYRLPKSGGSAATLATAVPTSVDLLVGDAGIFFATVSEGILWMPPTGGATRSIVVDPPMQPGAMAADATSLYWVDTNYRAVRRVPVAGGAITTLAALPSKPTDIAIDDTCVYWTSDDPIGAVGKAAR